MIQDAPRPQKPDPNQPCPCLSGAEFGSCCGADENAVPSGVIIVRHALSDKKCDDMVKYLRNQPRRDSYVGASNAQWSQKKYAESEGRITFEVKPGKLKTRLEKLVASSFSDILRREFGKTLLWYQAPSILLYQEGCWYGAHADSENYNGKTRSWQRVMDRDFSMLLYLSDDFEGGNITFLRFGFTYRPAKGDLIIFPSDNRYLHTAEKVTAGHRYAVVSFCASEESEKTQLRLPEDAILVGADNQGAVAHNRLGQAISEFTE